MGKEIEMSDWYTEGLVQLKTDIVEDTGVSLEDVDKVYAYLSNTT